MGRIEKSFNAIIQIIGAIDEIAFWTNLPALDAGVATSPSSRPSLEYTSESF
jgi:hypothetical protein